MSEETIESLKEELANVHAQLETSKQMFNESVNNVFNLKMNLNSMLKLLNEKDKQLKELSVLPA